MFKRNIIFNVLILASLFSACSDPNYNDVYRPEVALFAQPSGTPEGKELIILMTRGMNENSKWAGRYNDKLYQDK